jgi:hypothetical protein
MQRDVGPRLRRHRGLVDYVVVHLGRHIVTLADVEAGAPSQRVRYETGSPQAAGEESKGG